MTFLVSRHKFWEFTKKMSSNLVHKALILIVWVKNKHFLFKHPVVNASLSGLCGLAGAPHTDPGELKNMRNSIELVRLVKVR